MLEKIRGKTRDLLKPLAKNIKGINPNTLTLLGLVISIIAAVFLALQEVLEAGFFIIISGFLDVLDGAVARENDRMTRFGGFLDSVCDRFADSAIIIGAMYGGLTVFPPFPDWLIGTLAIVGSNMVSYTRARAEAAGGSASVGPGERAVRMIIIVVGAFIDKVNWAILLVGVLSFITVFQRIAYARRTLK
ncbi:MAG: CDP-alcohol phosphatidyltransferase family protein [Candidatus Methanoperedens sp.]|nr:CDP-alcohol phosphatidyltransferase family protein [Candidatus Methanoperedens sp.]MCE8427557.1 CDP-alcohol phosphatidyltransferase family protein [Candidatus Methanoperedens sp.]